MSEEPWIKPRKTYEQRRIDQHRKWFGQHRETLPAQAEIVIAELLAMNTHQREVINQLLLDLSKVTGKDNPDRLHDQHQDGTRLELRSDKRYRARRLEWEGQ